MRRLIDGNALASLFRTRRALEGNPNAQDAFEVAMWDAVNAEEVTLNDLRDAVYEDAVAHGLWEDADKYRNGWLCISEEHANRELWSEAAHFVRSEAYELVDVADKDVYRMTDSKDAFIDELADVIIMSLSVAGKLGIDIDAAVKRKMEVNKERPWKHEGEKK